ncbi:MAG: dTDP-4-dehydrorhamnose 3,5-epimerase [Beijerinckiaceae bacterium]|nr:dTDP-4-dehydrorhamnose 3,5-epimerase [Beijerinckiaceae bacterium]
MIITALEIEGIFLVEPEPIPDERGLFARIFCADTFRQAGLESDFVQHSVSYNERRGTLRGLHYQAPPHAETKLVRCTAGAVFDVAVDLRRGSGTYGRHVSTELSAVNRRALYIPRGCAHGFLTLGDAAEVAYLISPAFVSGASRGIRWNDPDLAIRWPGEALMVSPKDSALPGFQSIAHDAVGMPS